MVDNGIDDYKILGIPVYNPNNYQELNDLDPLFLEVTEDFFRNYKNNDRKKKDTVVVNGWVDRIKSLELINKSHNAYRKIFNSATTIP
jgi:inorganic pyrophosphatase